MIQISDNTIRLYWSKDALFNSVCDESAYNARNIANDKGESLFDRYAMSEDERLFFDDRLYAAFGEVYRHFRRIIPDEKVEETDPDLFGITFTARVSRDGCRLYSDNDLQELDRLATRILCSHVLREWYISVQLNELVTLYTQKLSVLSAMISELMFRFCRPESRPAYDIVLCPHNLELNISIDGGGSA